MSKKWVTNIRGNQGPTGARGPEGKPGAPGAGQLPTDQAIASHVETEGSLSRDAVHAATSVLAPARSAFSGAVPNEWSEPQTILTRAQIEFVMNRSGQGNLPYSPCIVKMPDGLPGQLGRYYLYWSTDHSTGRGGIHMAYADHPLGPWTPLDVTKLTIPAWMQGMPNTGSTAEWRAFYHKNSTAYMDYELVTPTGTQTETPWVMPDLSGERRFVMYYHCFNAEEMHGTIGRQSTFFAKSDDGINWVRGRKPLAPGGTLSDYTRAQALIFPYGRLVSDSDGHTGYASFYDIGSQRIAYSLAGGDHQAMWHSTDGMTFRMDPRRMGYRADLTGDPQLKMTGLYRLFQWRGEIWGTTYVQTPAGGTTLPTRVQAVVGRMRPDLRHFAGGIHETPFKPASTVEGEDGYLYGISTGLVNGERVIIARKLKA